MILSIRGWITILIISLLTSLLGFNQEIIFFTIYTLIFIITNLFISFNNLYLPKENLNKFIILIIQTSLIYIIAFVISKCFNINFYTTFEASTFVLALFINILKKY